MPKVQRMWSKYYTSIRKAIWRATGKSIGSAVTGVIKTVIRLITGKINRGRYIEAVKLGLSLLTLAGWAAMFLDYFSDLSLNGYVYLWKSRK